MNAKRHVVCLAIASFGLSSASGALAQEANPYYVGIAQAFTHESNLFRVATGQPETSDTFSTTAAPANFVPTTDANGSATGMPRPYDTAAKSAYSML